MGQAHKTVVENNNSVSTPNELEKYCVVDAKAGKNFVVCIVESGELFVFDGCLELVKLPLRYGIKIDKVFVVQQTILGICENNYLIQ